MNLHTCTVAQWVKAMHADGANGFFACPTPAKRREVRHFCQTRLNAGQISFNKAEASKWAARSASSFSSAFSSMREAYKAEFSIYRIIGGSNGGRESFTIGGVTVTLQY